MSNIAKYQRSTTKLAEISDEVSEIIIKKNYYNLFLWDFMRPKCVFFLGKPNFLYTY